MPTFQILKLILINRHPASEQNSLTDAFLFQCFITDAFLSLHIKAAVFNIITKK